MGSLETPTTTETNSLTTSNGGDHKLSVTAKGAPPPSADSTIMMAQESEATRKRRASMLPLEVGTRVMCRWRDGKYHPVRVIERRKMHYGGPNDYEYYVDYTESNRRLDEWVKLEQLDLDSVETVVDEKVEDKITSLKMTHHQKRKIDETNVEGHEELDAV